MTRFDDLEYQRDAALAAGPPDRGRAALDEAACPDCNGRQLDRLDSGGLRCRECGLALADVVELLAWFALPARYAVQYGHRCGSYEHSTHRSIASALATVADEKDATFRRARAQGAEPEAHVWLIYDDDDPERGNLADSECGCGGPGDPPPPLGLDDACPECGLARFTTGDDGEPRWARHGDRL